MARQEIGLDMKPETLARWGGVKQLDLPRSFWIGLVLLAPLIITTRVILLSIVHYTDEFSFIWLANAIVVIALLKNPTRTWPYIAAVAYGSYFLSNQISGAESSEIAVFATLCNMVEIFTVTVPLRYFGGDLNFTKIFPLLAFYILALIFAPILSGAMYAASFHYSPSPNVHIPELSDFGKIIWSWYLPHALGMAAIAPLGLCSSKKEFGALFSRQSLPGTIGLLLALISIFSCIHLWPSLPLAMLLLPIVVLFVFYLGFAGTTISVVAIAFFLEGNLALLDMSVGHRTPFVDENFIRMQFWLLAISATAMTLGAMLSEQRALNERLIEANEIAVTALQKAENLRMSAEAAARSKTLFLANMSHELRTPLNAIIGFSDIIKSGLFGPVGSSKYSEYASDIYASGKHLLSVISDVLDMSKIEAGKIELNPEPSDLCALIRFSTHTVETNAENIGITLITKIPRHPVLLNVDPRAIKQILLNLLSNAIKFTPKGGEVIVRLVHDEKGTSIEIEDTGIGIPLDQLPLLGKPFVQLKNDPMTTHEGTGLGLALARSLTEGHGGSLLIESALSRGTKVTVFLPVAIEYEQAKQLG